MRTIETEINIKESGQAVLSIPKDLIPGKYKAVLVVYDESDDYSVSDEIDSAYKAELDRRLEDFEKNPQEGYTMEEIILRMEKRIGRNPKKLQDRINNDL